MMDNINTFALHGDICYSISPAKIACVNDGYVVVNGGKISAVLKHRPNITIHDYEGHIVIPGMTDLHTHAPQFPFRGLGANTELLEWLDTLIFPEEGKYSDTSYAEQVYSSFVEALKRSPTTRAVIFATIHAPATKILMSKLEESGLASYVGKVSSDRNVPNYLCERNPVEELEAWLEDVSCYRHTKPIITPRFIPACTDDLMQKLAEIREKYNLPVQSHLSENLSEIAWVHELCPWALSYADIYDSFGILDERSIMAHCVHLTDNEVELLKARGTFIAHCPNSNMNLHSGIAPAKHYMKMGLNIGLATDIAGGAYISMFRAITEAVSVSKLRSMFIEKSEPLTFEEAFYLATVGSGTFFGNVGSFMPGCEADILVMSGQAHDLNLRCRLEREISLAGDDAELAAKYVSGKKLF